jgi:hypothetical protein
MSQAAIAMFPSIGSHYYSIKAASSTKLNFIKKKKLMRKMAGKVPNLVKKSDGAHGYNNSPAST